MMSWKSKYSLPPPLDFGTKQMKLWFIIGSIFGIGVSEPEVQLQLCLQEMKRVIFTPISDYG